MMTNENLIQDELKDPGGDWKIVRNPVNLARFGKDVRGVITGSGDLYLESHSDGTIHHDILEILFDHGVLEGTFSRGWTKQLPEESGFLTVQRHGRTPMICIGESNRLLYRKAGYLEKIHLYRPFLERAFLKNPGIRFMDKLIRIKGNFTGDEAFVTIRSLGL